MKNNRIITQNRAMKSLIENFVQNKNIKDSKETLIILLQGQTGTGKEVFAREIHDRSGATGKFVAVNCAAISDDLFWSHWFGHSKGLGHLMIEPGLLRKLKKAPYF